MKLWHFTFTDPALQLGMVDVAAPSKDEACGVIFQQLSMMVDLGEANRRSRHRVIASYLGEDSRLVEPALLSATSRQGQKVVFEQ